MRQYKEYTYESVLAPFIRDFISEGRSLGYIYEGKAYQLHRFDRYWLNKGYGDTNLTPERLGDWICALPGESRSSQSRRQAQPEAGAVAALERQEAHRDPIGDGCWGRGCARA